MGKRQRRTIGSIVEVPVDEFHVHAQILAETDLVFFDTKNVAELTPNTVLASEVLFRLASESHAILDGRWPKIGKVAVVGELSEPVAMFIQDALDPEKFQIYYGGEIRVATRQECENLDRAAVWAVNHIEDRIRDHYNNQPNIWYEQLRLK